MGRWKRDIHALKSRQFRLGKNENESGERERGYGLKETQGEESMGKKKRIKEGNR